MVHIASDLLIAIDPGEKYCGFAVFQGGHILKAQTMPPEDMLGRLERELYMKLGWSLTVVIEEFRVYDNKPMTWSDCRTIEVIGVVAWLCTRHGVELVRQPAHLKKPTAGHVRHRGVTLIGDTVHARDAELHGYHYLWAPGA